MRQLFIITFCIQLMLPAFAQTFLGKYQKALLALRKNNHSRAVQLFEQVLPEAKDVYDFDEQDTTYLFSLYYLGVSYQALNQYH